MSVWKKEIRARLSGLELEPTREAAIVEELSQDLDEFYVDLIAGGATPAEAARQTIAELNEHELLARELQRVERLTNQEPIPSNPNRRGHMIRELWRDLRYGARMLRKTPGFTLITVATLALGIGANAVLFSVVDGVLFKPMPYPNPERLVTIHQSREQLHFDLGSIPYLNFLDLERENRSFASMAVARGSSFRLTGLGEDEQLAAQRISSEFFSTLGVTPLLGRSFTRDEDKIGAGPVAMISEELWRRKFGGSPEALGKGMKLDDRIHTIVGVIPSSFQFRASSFHVSDVYIPIGQHDWPLMKNRGAGLGIHGIGRLKPGVTIEQGQADLSRVMAGLAAAFPGTNQGAGAKIVPLKDRVVGSIRRPLLFLLGAVAFVLLIACVNVSNLLLARSTGRAREFAIRQALGAGQWRLLRQLLAESVLLALLGGALGLMLAQWGLKAALAASPTALPRAEEIGVDPRALLFTLAISLLAGIAAGLAPALKPSRLRLAETLKESGQGMSLARVRTQRIFVAVEMALALVLLIGAGLMVRSLHALINVDPGFRAENVLTLTLSTPPSLKTASPEAVRAVLQDVRDQIRAKPGVAAVSYSWGAMPLAGDDEEFFWLDTEAKPETQRQMKAALYYSVEPEYLSAMRIPLEQGRFLSEQDDERSPLVAVIDEAFARQHFGDQSPLGRRINLERWGGRAAEIVGVVGHVKQWGLAEDEKHSIQSQLYTSFRQIPGSVLKLGPPMLGMIVRTEAEDATLFESLRRQVQTKNGRMLLTRPRMMEEIIVGSLATQRFTMILLDAFALTALLLASVGLYGVVSYLVAQQTREIGVRLALGARPADVLRLVLTHGMKMALAGLALGVIASFGLTRLMTKMLYGVSATDPITFAIISLLLMGIALAACYFPARRATKVDPLVALRSE